MRRAAPLVISLAALALAAAPAHAQPTSPRTRPLDEQTLGDYLRAVTAIDAVAQMRFDGDLLEGIQIQALTLRSSWKSPPGGGAPRLTSLEIGPEDAKTSAPAPEWLGRVRGLVGRPVAGGVVELPGVGRIDGVRRVLPRPDGGVTLDVSGFDYVVEGSGRVKRGVKTLLEPPGEGKLGGWIEKVTIDEQGVARIRLRKLGIPYTVKITKVEREANGDLRIHTAPLVPDLTIRARDGAIKAWGVELLRSRVDLSKLKWPPSLDDLAALGASAGAPAPASGGAGAGARGAPTPATATSLARIRYQVKAVMDPAALARLAGARSAKGKASLDVSGDVRLSTDGVRTVGDNALKLDADLALDETGRRASPLDLGPVDLTRLKARTALRGSFAFDSSQPGGALRLSAEGPLDLALAAEMGAGRLTLGPVALSDAAGAVELHGRGKVNIRNGTTTVRADGQGSVEANRGVVTVLDGSRGEARVAPGTRLEGEVTGLEVTSTPARTRGRAGARGGAAGPATLDARIESARLAGRVAVAGVKLDGPVPVTAPDGATLDVTGTVRANEARGHDVSGRVAVNLGGPTTVGLPLGGDEPSSVTLGAGTGAEVHVDSARIGRDGRLERVDARVSGALVLASSDLRRGDLAARVIGKGALTNARIRDAGDGLTAEVPVEITLEPGTTVRVPGVQDPVAIDRPGSKARFTAIVARGPDGKPALTELRAVELHLETGQARRLPLGGTTGAARGMVVNGVQVMHLRAARIAVNGKGLELFDGEVTTGVRSETPGKPFLAIDF
jgi:hypothetical protein